MGSLAELDEMLNSQTQGMMVDGVFSPCREYQGARHVRGYGKRIWRHDGKQRSQMMHRWVWEQMNGPIPPGMVVMHLCDNPPCFRYEHLRLGTQAENLADMRAKDRWQNQWQGRTECVHGHPYTDENTYRPPGRPHWRMCRACMRARGR